ncbi:MAG: uroporphyrinogen decarboxylase family protein [Ktedonobacteraceae bacterium]
MMPISIVKALIQGQPPARRLFVPLIFTLAAKLEDVPLSNFVVNPTKIANSLAAIYQRLRLDGVTCYYDLFLVAEALGCQLNLSTSPPALERPTRETALKMLQQRGDVKQRGRLPVALEVVHRLRGTLRNSPALVIGLPGPLRIAQQLFGQDVLRELAEGDDDALDSFETLVEITLSVAQAFCLAGTHLLYFDELDVPVEFLAIWQETMVAVWKTVRFHGALPVLSTPQPLQFEDPANAPLLCLKPAPGDQAPLSGMPFALALPAVEETFPDVSPWLRAKECVLMTTDGEIPYQLEIQKLQQHVAAMRSLFES